MSDIVEKLRERPWRHGGETEIGAKERRQREREEAADEITRLTEEVERLREMQRTVLVEQGEMVATLTARVKELEGALRAAYEVYAGSEGFVPETAAEGYQQQIIKQMVDCISAALTQPGITKGESRE